MSNFSEAVREQSAEDTEAMKFFLGILAHELRSQLATIGTISNALLYDENMDNELKRFHYTAMRATSNHLLQILDNMMATAKFNKGLLELEPNYTRICFMKWFQGLIEPFDFYATTGGITIDIALSPDIPEYLVVDSIKLGQVLSNLLTNAVKSSPEGSTLTVNIFMGKENQLSFEVIDQGGGIKPDKLPLLFQPFRQLEKGRAGTGLGLYISKLYIVSMGGEIKVRSSTSGTTFSFFIPIILNSPLL